MKSDYQYSIILKLKSLRINCGYSQSKIAQTLEISAGQLGNIESCKQKHKYTLKQLYKLCKLFDYPITELFMGENNSAISNVDLIEKIIEYEQNN